MSSKVILDADELERFARNLRAFNLQLQDSMKRLSWDCTRLAETWRDPAHLQFERELEQTTAALTQFLRVADAYVPFLMAKARRAREVH